MTTEILIYALERGETRDYMESLLACFPSTDKAAANVEKVKAAASADGWHSFRIAKFVSGTVPNFAKAVNV